MKFLKLSALSLLFTLTACGGGGGNGGDVAHTPINDASSQQSTPAKPSNDSNKPETQTPSVPSDSTDSTDSTVPSSPTPKPVHGHYLWGAGRNNVGISAHSISGNKLEILDDFFTSIPLSDPAKSPTDGYYEIGNGIVNDNSFLKDTKFGIVEKDRVYIFAQGNRATDMPTNGSASYTGETVVVVVNKDEDNKLIYAKVPTKFDVDFDKKQLIGSLEFTKLNTEEKRYFDDNIRFDADIQDDKFSKRAFSSDISVNGAFYGHQASELGGVLLKRDSFSGAFGAKKDTE